MNAIITKNKHVVDIEAFVESESKAGTYYRVAYNGHEWSCTCPCGQLGNGKTCRHITAVAEETDVK